MSLLPDSQRVYQTKFYNGQPGSGNCTEAAVATLLGLPLDQVPTFYTGESGSQHLNMERFFNERGYELEVCSANISPECMYLVSGKSSRGCSHMVVYYDGQLLHDPHPSGEGVLSVSHAFLAMPRNPGLFQLRT